MILRRLFPEDVSGKSVLHVGCGEGELCQFALRKGAARVVGVDVDPSRIERASSKSRPTGGEAAFHVTREDSDEGARQRATRSSVPSATVETITSASTGMSPGATDTRRFRLTPGQYQSIRGTPAGETPPRRLTHASIGRPSSLGIGG